MAVKNSYASTQPVCKRTMHFGYNLFAFLFSSSIEQFINIITLGVTIILFPIPFFFIFIIIIKP